MKVFGRLFASGRGRDLNELGIFLRGKSVALVGNAWSLRHEEDRINASEVVIRMNKGYYHLDDAGQKILRRTDMLLVSCAHEDAFLNDVSTVVRMTPKKRDRLEKWATKSMYFYPLPWWEELFNEIGSRPSTGCMGIDLVTRLAEPRQVSLWGFDFWKSPTFYTGENRPGPHNPRAEEEFARKRLPHAFPSTSSDEVGSSCDEPNS